MTGGEQSQQAQISAVAALGKSSRRRLYDYMVRQPEPVSRDEAAAALELPRSTVAFHLDRLVGEHLFSVDYQRRAGRTGPGAGRPAKLYRRPDQHEAVSLPQRRYELAGQLLSSAVEHAERSGDSPRASLDQLAYQLGKKFGETARSTAENLEEHGFEPRREGNQVTFANCPFHTLAQEYTELACGMNLHLLDGLLEGLAPTGLIAQLDPTPPTAASASPRSSGPASDTNPRDEGAAHTTQLPCISDLL